MICYIWVSAAAKFVDDTTVQANEGACTIRSNIDENQPGDRTVSQTDNVEGGKDRSVLPDESLPKKGG